MVDNGISTFTLCSVSSDGKARTQDDIANHRIPSQPAKLYDPTQAEVWTGSFVSCLMLLSASDILFV